MYHFNFGYTAKVAVTDEGVKVPVATVSACSGAPFPQRHPCVYAEMLAAKLGQVSASAYLENTRQLIDRSMMVPGDGRVAGDASAWTPAAQECHQGRAQGDPQATGGMNLEGKRAEEFNKTHAVLTARSLEQLSMQRSKEEAMLSRAAWAHARDDAVRNF